MAAATAVDPRRHRVAPWRRLNDPERISGVDLARGLAVVGMLAAHLLVRPDLDWQDPHTWVAIVDGRSSILFATLAGVSLGLVTGGRRPITGRALHLARRRIAVRAVLLFTIGVLLMATGIPLYVILPAYAILFLLAILLIPFGARTLFLFAGVIGLLMPFAYTVLNALPLWSEPAGPELALLLGWHYPFPVWIAFVAAGMGVARAGVTRIAVQRAALGVGVTLAVTGYSLDALTGTDGHGDAPWDRAWTAVPHSSGVLEAFGSGGFALAVLAACLLACRTPLTWVALPLRAVGAMPLTAYVAQCGIWAVWALVALGETGDLTAFRDLQPFWPLTVGVVAGCTLWAVVIGRGPLEWLVSTVAERLVPSSGGRFRGRR